MTKNRDPKTCTDCGTVNPWLNETCRECGAALLQNGAETSEVSDERGESVNPVESESAYDNSPAIGAGAGVPEANASPPVLDLRKARRRWNIRWILIGVALHFLTLPIAEFAFAKFVIAGDPEMKAVVEELVQIEDPSTLSDVQKEQYKTRIFSDGRFVLFVTAIFLAPLFIGLFIGFFSGGILDGAAAMGISTIVYCFLINKIAVAFIIGPINVGLGAAGAWGGYLLRTKIQNN
jgi:ribosomal protein L40E